MYALMSGFFVRPSFRVGAAGLGRHHGWHTMGKKSRAVVEEIQRQGLHHWRAQGCKRRRLVQEPKHLALMVQKRLSRTTEDQNPSEAENVKARPR